MRKLQLVMAYLTLLLMFSTAVCGMWINSAGSEVADPESSIRFHMAIGISTAISYLVTFITILLNKNKPLKKELTDNSIQHTP